MTNVAIENGRVEIVSFPMNGMVMLHVHVQLPEGIYMNVDRCPLAIGSLT